MTMHPSNQNSEMLQQTELHNASLEPEVIEMVLNRFLADVQKSNVSDDFYLELEIIGLDYLKELKR